MRACVRACVRVSCFTYFVKCSTLLFLIEGAVRSPCSRCIRLRAHAEVHVAPKPHARPLTPGLGPASSPRATEQDAFPDVAVKLLSLRRVMTLDKGSCRARFVRGSAYEARRCTDTCPAARVNPCTARSMLGTCNHLLCACIRQVIFAVGFSLQSAL